MLIKRNGGAQFKLLDFFEDEFRMDQTLFKILLRRFGTVFEGSYLTFTNSYLIAFSDTDRCEFLVVVTYILFRLFIIFLLFIYLFIYLLLFAEKEDHGNRMESPSFEKKHEDAMLTEFKPLVEKKLNEEKTNDQDEKVLPVIWDFAGQDIFRAIHPMFMYPEDLYLLVFDITQQLSDRAKCQVDQSIVQARDSDDTDWDHVMRWFELIHSLNQCDEKEVACVESLTPPVIVVGTHAVSPDPSTDEAVIKTK